MHAECNGRRIIHYYDTGETVCCNCGLVTDEWSCDEEPEWRSFNAEEYDARARVGMPTQYSVYDKGLTTTIDASRKNALGRRLPPSVYFKMKRLRKWQIRSSAFSSVDRNFAQAMDELDRMCGLLPIPQATKEVAAVIYRKALEKSLVRGRSIAALVAASLYAACRMVGVERSLREVADISLAGRRGSKPKSRWRSAGKKDACMHKHKMPMPDPMSCLSKIAEKYMVSGKTREVAVHILREASKRRLLADKDPMSVASAALYIACVLCKEGKNQAEIAVAAGVTEVTVRKRYKDFVKELDLEIERRKPTARS
jgi:transcription initiation factor TFIIB